VFESLGESLHHFPQTGLTILARQVQFFGERLA
jgi:hypothetical protein